MRNLILVGEDATVAFSKFNFEFKSSLGVNSVTELRTQLKALFNNPAYNTQEINNINMTIAQLRDELNDIPQMFDPYGGAQFLNLDHFFDSATLGVNSLGSFKLID